MWRTLGWNGLSLVSLLMAVTVVMTLAALIYVLLMPTLEEKASLIYQVLVLLMVMVLVCIVLTVAYQASFFAYSENRQRHRNQQLDRWAAVWNAVVFNQAPTPSTRDPLAAEGLLSLKGFHLDQHGRIGQLYDQSGLLAADVRTLQGRGPVLNKIQVLERWMLLCEEKTHPHLEASRHASHPEVAFLAFAALARSMGVNRTPGDLVARTFTEVFVGGQFSSGRLEQVLVLLGEQGTTLIQHLLQDPSVRLQLLALHALVYIDTTACEAECLELLDSKDPDVRASSLKVLALRGVLPGVGSETVMGMVTDPVWFVRAQAVRASASLQDRRVLQVLYDGLADASWWVRHNSAVALMQRGPDGLHTLQNAQLHHHDPYARDMAHQHLLVF
ncbi:HEAT repeat domain-containing protein [Deinococcus cellulosilyticus]|uniref:HEAT repeat domain-containing protein n=1 Tax=Deinococcus cellulosilyticus (strain DSM 18568 / NBRC 106333 / KACC 11606 / 5516J-15) TaxID=1223518 RepID=A0A511NAN5_DEIC1|nr:HEAT repeat domain-containing protein [Deinococcus cellulosilyticus]GEM49889.1 hypothetical protein DC3_55240 [Deinococcus cellulosilyticus NBRC 106333 = KACC 11606]